jgi:hypothetical protein
VKGKASPHGIWTHLPPGGGKVSLTYKLDEKFDTFCCQVSLNDGPPRCIPLTFEVIGDGKVLWTSKPVTSQADTQTCKDISVRGVKMLTLKVSGTGDERGTHGVWIEPALSK